MKNNQIDEFLKLVDLKFAGQIPNGPDDPRRLTVGLVHDCTGLVTFAPGVSHQLLFWQDFFLGINQSMIDLLKQLNFLRYSWMIFFIYIMLYFLKSQIAR